MRFAVITALALAAIGIAGQNPDVTQRGPYWERNNDSEPQQLSPQVKRVEVFTRANVTVRGSEDDVLRIHIRQRVRAASAEQAGRIMGPLRHARLIAQGPSVLRMELYPPGMFSNEVEIWLPRKMPVVWINNQSGSVAIYDFDGTVRADTGGGPIVIDRVRGDARAHTGLGDVRMGSIGGTIICTSGGGTITLLFASSDANCATGGGNISVKSVAGPLVVSTEGGNIRVEKAGSTVRAKSMAGLVEVGEARGAVFADSGGGTVRVRGGSGPLSVSTMLGDIMADLLGGGRFADSSLSAGSGDIVVTIPTSLGLAVRARNDSGLAPRIVSDFPDIQTRSMSFRSPVMIGQGTINGGGPMLDLNANGTIYLRRVK